MIYEFRSRATGSIVMTAKVAERMLGIVGKPASPQGIITVTQLPEAIARLRVAIADEQHARKAAREAALIPLEEMRELFGEEALVAVLPAERLAAEAVVGVDYAEHLMEDTINGHQ